MKFIKVCIIAVFLFYVLPVQYVSAADEIAKPTIESFQVDNNQVTSGDVVTISIGVKGNTTYKYLNLSYSSPTDKGITIKLNYDEQTQLFVGSFPITDHIESGNYIPHMISLYNSGITTIYNSEYDGFDSGSFEVENTKGIEFIQNMKVDKSAVQIGDTVNFQLETASHAGVSYMRAYFQSPISTQSLSVPLYYNEEKNIFEGSIPISSIMENGIYTLTMLNTYEIGGNTTAFYSGNYNGEFESGNFTVSGADISNLIESITIDKNEVTVGETMEFAVRFSKFVGINYINLSFDSPITGYHFTVGLYYNSETDLFEGNFTPSLNFEEGKYPLSMIAVYDSSGNTTALYDVYNEFESGDFTFYREANLPVFNSVSLEKSEVTPGETVRVNVTAEDDTKLSEAVVHYVSPITQIRTPISLQYDSVEKQFYGDFYTDENSEVGTWKVDSIEIKDTNENLTVISKEETDLSAGNFIIKDVIIPEIHSINEITDQSTTISGKAESETSISVKNHEKEIGSTETNLDGDFSLAISKQTAGTKLTVTATDAAGNISEAKELIVRDVTAPNAPTVNEFTDKSTSVTGTGEVNAFISIKAGITELGTATVASDGTYKATIAVQKAGTKISILATDAAGNVSAAKAITVVDATAPNVPTVSEVTDMSTVVIGTAEAASQISVKAGSNELGTSTVAADGKFSVSIAKQKVGTKLTITAKDSAGNVSEAKQVTILDATAPETPTVDEITDRSFAVTGSGEMNSFISVKTAGKELGAGKVATYGKYNVAIAAQKAGTKIQVTSVDAAGNTSASEEVIVVDVTVPSLPVVNKVTDQSTAVAGTAEAASQITVKDGSEEVGAATVSANGTYSVTIPKRKAGTVLSITALDQAGNISEVKETTVVDGTAPTVALTSKVTHYSTRVIGTAEAASRISVKNGTTTIGTAIADAKGEYQVKIEKQKVGTKLSIIATDAAENSSAAIPVTVVDGNYSDLRVTHWALDAIMYLADDQIIGGYPEGGFQPEKNTTRAEAAKMLALAMDLPIKDVSSGYKDVTAKHWAKDYIAAVSKAGLFNGNPDGSFAPNDVLKRAEMAKVISIAYELDASDKNHFSDVKAGYWAKGYISGLYENGITTGFPDKTFHPEDPTTRAEYSVFLARALNEDFQ